MYFDLKKTAQYRAIKWSYNPLFRFNKPLRFLFFVGSAALFSLVGYAVWKGGFSDVAWEKFLGGGILCFALSIVFQELDVFFRTCFKQPKLKYSLADLLAKPQDFNFASFLDYDASLVCSAALKIAKKHKTEKPSAEMLLYGLSAVIPEAIRFVFGRAGIEPSALKGQAQARFSQSPAKPGNEVGNGAGFEAVILAAAAIAEQRQRKRISAGDILIALAETNPFFQNFLNEQDLKKQDLENLSFWYEKVKDQEAEFGQFWNYNNLLRKGGVARDLTSGYSLVLDRYSRDLRAGFRKGAFREIVGHQKEIKQLERVLEKQEMNNGLLVGEPGTGRRSVVEAVAQKAFLGKSVASVNYKRFLEFDLTALVAELAGRPGGIEMALEASFSEVVKAGNIVLVVQDFENFVEQQSKPGAVNITGILSRYLNFPKFQMVAVASYAGLHRTIEKNPALLRLFEKVEVEEISERETLVFLQNQIPFFEAKHRRYITYKAVREIVRLSSKYLGEIPFPDRALRLLDEAMAYLTTYTKDKALLAEHIQKIVSEKAGVPIGQAGEQEKEILLKLEELIHQRLINQETAVKQLASALRRARAEIKTKSGPIGSFLFLGPTGVGKTEAAKALTAIYFGHERRMIRMDMSEFQNPEDIKRFIGSPETEGLLTTAVREAPFSLVLLDELEKAHPNILSLFLQVLDEGWLTDGLGRKVDFKNTIIIATSNAGAEFIRQRVQEGKDAPGFRDELIDLLLKQGIFRPEFINRFDAVVVFRPLTKEHLLAIAHLQLKKLAQALEDKGIKFEITPELKERIVQLSYKPEFGAREMKRVIQDNIEDVLARAILSDELKRGNTVTVNPVDFKLVVS